MWYSDDMDQRVAENIQKTLQDPLPALWTDYLKIIW